MREDGVGGGGGWGKGKDAEYPDRLTRLLSNFITVCLIS